MSYNKDAYDRKKRGEVLRSSLEYQKDAFDSIREKWNINDRTISKLLRDYTKTEILEGDFEGNVFTPGIRLTVPRD